MLGSSYRNQTLRAALASNVWHLELHNNFKWKNMTHSRHNVLSSLSFSLSRRHCHNFSLMIRSSNSTDATRSAVKHGSREIAAPLIHLSTTYISRYIIHTKLIYMRVIHAELGRMAGVRNIAVVGWEKSPRIVLSTRDLLYYSRASANTQADNRNQVIVNGERVNSISSRVLDLELNLGRNIANACARCWLSY